MVNDFSGGMFREFANKEISADKDKYLEYCEFARQLNTKEINLENDLFFIDCLHQPYKGRKEYNHVDAYFIAQILDAFFSGKILFGIFETDSKADKNKEKIKNNKQLKSARPIFGSLNQFDSEFIGDNECWDGYLKFEGNVKFLQHGEQNDVNIEKFDGLLEVGSCDIATVWSHLFVNKGQLARFPYKHKMIGLFIKTDFDSSMKSFYDNLHNIFEV